jgi:hypothetical protein
LGAHRLSLRKLAEAPHGLEIGRLALAPEAFLEDVPRLEASLAAAAAARDGPLLLIGRRQLRSNNSWMHNGERLVKERDACALLLNPGDTAARRPARRQSRGGELPRGRRRGGVAARVTEDVARRGEPAARLGHARPDVRVGAAHAGASLNDRTDEQSVDALSWERRLQRHPGDRCAGVIRSAPLCAPGRSEAPCGAAGGARVALAVSPRPRRARCGT